MWEGIHSTAGYGSEPTEYSLRKGGSGTGTDGRRGRYLDIGEGDGDRGGDAAHLVNACGDARRETAWGNLSGTHLLSHPTG